MSLLTDQAKANNSYSGPADKTPQQRLPPGAQWPTAIPTKFTPLTGRTHPQYQGNNMDPAAHAAAKNYKYNGAFGDSPIGTIKNADGSPVTWSLAQDPNEYSSPTRLSPHGRFARGAPYNPEVQWKGFTQPDRPGYADAGYQSSHDEFQRARGRH